MSQTFTIPSVFKAIDKYTAPVRKMQSATSRFAAVAETSVIRAERGFRRMMSPVRRLNRMLGGFGLLIGGSLFIGAVTSAVNVFKDFEQANAVVASVMSNATQPELKALQEDAKRLGATTAKSATEEVQLQEAYARIEIAAGDT